MSWGGVRGHWERVGPQLVRRDSCRLSDHQDFCQGRTATAILPETNRLHRDPRYVSKVSVTNIPGDKGVIECHSLLSNKTLDQAITKSSGSRQHGVGSFPLMANRSRRPKPASAVSKEFGARLKRLRQDYGREIGQPGLSQASFAALFGVEGETYGRYERGETEPPLHTLQEIRRVTGVNLNNLISGEIDRAA